MTADKPGLTQGNCAVRVLVPCIVAKALAKPAKIEKMQAAGMAPSFCEKAVPPGPVTEISEMVVTIDGPADGLSTALGIVAQHVAGLARSGDKFTKWIMNSLCGMTFEGLADLFGTGSVVPMPAPMAPAPMAPMNNMPAMDMSIPGQGAPPLPGNNGMPPMTGDMGMGGSMAMGGGVGGMGGGMGMGMDPGPCQFFLQGNCALGADCQFSHSIPPGGMGAMVPVPEVAVANMGMAMQPTQPVAVALTLKFLLSSAESATVLGKGGNTIKAIAQETASKITLSGKNELYPGTMLQEMKMSGKDAERTLQAAQYAYAEIAKHFGAINAGEESVQPGHARMRIVVPSRVIKSIIGKGGENIKQMRSELGMFLHVDDTPIPPGPISHTTEQVICLNGPLEGVSGSLAAISSFIAACSSEPWFDTWSKNSHCGQTYTGLVLSLDSAAKGAGKGAVPGPPAIPALPDMSVGALQDPAVMAAMNGGSDLSTAVVPVTTEAQSAQAKKMQETSQQMALAASMATNTTNTAAVGTIAIKMLVSVDERMAISADVNVLISIQQATGTTINMSEGVYPGSELYELTVQCNGPHDVAAGAVLTAMVELYNIVLITNGRLTAGDDNVPGTTCRVKLVMPALAASGIIGKGGQMVKLISKSCNARVAVDMNTIPVPEHGDLREQVVRLDALAKDITLAFHMVMESVLTIGIGKGLETWAATTNAGNIIPGVVLFSTAIGGPKGSKGKSKGKDKDKGK
eukprot:gnl/MRDRNA2_/MRDRNA2_75461_c0_seq1.p1 gnl/MRDRNA2_/MRDRNA2_75461_c0~~gnl/MRDRNA2_/MRDRNA2_75461_c0_seq1.p1  ORF type:complete len:778 (+),score=154.55 gnl/MRDRNA2_/MRDRNA2_75461_c0_seq1:108-2336(+)